MHLRPGAEACREDIIKAESIANRDLDERVSPRANSTTTATTSWSPSRIGLAKPNSADQADAEEDWPFKADLETCT